LVVYGSYIRGAEELGDLDLACKLWPKIEDADERKKKFIQHWRDAGAARVLAGFEIRWPYDEVMAFLKNRRRTISLHDMDDFI